MRINLLVIALAAVAFPAVAAAEPGVSGSPPINSAYMVSAPVGVLEMPALGAALAPVRRARAPRLESYVRRRPSPYPRRSYRRSPGPPVAAQIYFGFFNPVDDFSTGFDGGFRVGPRLSPFLQMGVAMDWWHRSDDEVLDIGEVETPGGTANEKLILSESTANLVPFLMFVQVNGNDNMPVIPYAGMGLGYEWLFLSAHDYATHESFDQTFGGFGWQAWGGVGFALDPRTRLTAEVFFNACEVDSEVDVYLDDYGLVTVRDVVDMNGVGARFGLSFMF